MCVCVRMYVYICMYTYVYIYIYRVASEHVVDPPLPSCACEFNKSCVCVSVCVHIYVHTYVYIYIYIVALNTLLTLRSHPVYVSHTNTWFMWYIMRVCVRIYAHTYTYIYIYICISLWTRCWQLLHPIHVRVKYYVCVCVYIYK